MADGFKSVIYIVVRDMMVVGKERERERSDVVFILAFINIILGEV